MLRKSISTTKKLFQKTLKTLKSFLSQDYQRLPKSPPLNPFMEIDKLERRSKKKIASSPVKNHEKEVFTKMSFGNHCEEDHQEKKGLVCEGKSIKKGFMVKEGIIRSCLVQQKLKELEMVDRSNIEHVLDIEEVLYYYSRLTCSAYIDIVDKFLMEIYAEISNSTPTIGSSKW
ncbi:Transcription repressor like [Actinidia chinensis var. chinensis]|uniref:Transcription repressor like n=1 Tax=Actinidia chinensis var. chinensis TaxID=1590841 RepID=A0A2R6QV28_ACTCC|nr:Transcription repressor like [Actinidia chinensis var. chinensis]